MPSSRATRYARFSSTSRSRPRHWLPSCAPTSKLPCGTACSTTNSPDGCCSFTRTVSTAIPTSKNARTADLFLDRRLASGPPFVGARAAEKVLDGVVPFVALDAEHRGIGRPERPFGGPRTRPRVRILDSHAIPERLRVDASEALDDVEAFAGIEVVALAAEVRRVHDERLAFVMSDRI